MTAIEILNLIVNQFPQADPDHELYDTGINGGDAVDFICEIVPEIIACLAAPRPKVAVILEGGLVQEIVSDRPGDVPATFMVVDYDVEGADKEEIIEVTSPDEIGEACARIVEVGEAVISLDGVHQQLIAR